MIPDPKHFLVRLAGTRPGWPEAMTEAEQAVMASHFVYLRTLTWQGKCLLAGPVFGAGGFGLVVLQTADEAEARAIMDAEPSVTGGVHTYTLNPMVASLMHGRQVFRHGRASARLFGRRRCRRPARRHGGPGQPKTVCAVSFRLTLAWNCAPAVRSRFCFPPTVPRVKGEGKGARCSPSSPNGCWP